MQSCGSVRQLIIIMFVNLIKGSWMKRIEKFLNFIHFCIYKLDYRLHMLSNKLNPFLLIGKLPAVKKKFEEQGTTHLDVVNKLWTDKRNGFGIMISGGGLAIIVFLIIWSIFLVLNSFLITPFKFSWQPFAICMGLAFTVCHYAVFQRDKYIRYFKEFEKWSSREKWKYGLLTFSFIVGAITLFIYSFWLLPAL